MNKTRDLSIFQLGTNNWQRDGDPAPGSGILHESHHNAMNNIEGVRSYSVYPSCRQASPATREDYRVFELEHEIPICEGAGPTSSYRWHAMSEEEVGSYRRRLETEVSAWIDQIEGRQGKALSFAIAHHSFLNPLVLREVMAHRARAQENGRPVPIFCFLHGTGLKMFANEMSGDSPEEFPHRFHPMMLESGIFGRGPGAVAGCFAVSPALRDEMARVFPDYPSEQVLIAPCGIDEAIFYNRRDVTVPGLLKRLGAPDWPRGLGSMDADRVERLVVYAGRFADWKRIEALLLAAKEYEAALPGTCTLIAGPGPAETVERCHKFAGELDLKSTYFIGPRSQQDLAELFSAAAVSVFPSFEEPFGMVFIEAMGCGSPVIGVASGGPRSFVDSSVGELVPEPGLDALEPLGRSLADAITRAVNEDWRELKGEACIRRVKERFRVGNQISTMLDQVEKILALD